MSDTAPSALPGFTTHRLVLRPLSESDVEEIFLLRSDKEITKFLDRKPCKSTEEALLFIQQITSNQALYWAIAEIQSKKLIGTICLFDFPNEHGSYEIGFELLTVYQRQGYMMEAVQTIINFVFQTRGMNALYASTHQHNHPSMRLLEKFSFHKMEIADELNPILAIYRLSKNNVLNSEI